MDLTNDDVQELLHLLDSAEVDEMHLDTESFSVSFNRTPGGWTQSTRDKRQPKLSGEVTTKSEPTTVVHEVVEGLTNVHAPLMGTFYRAPSPGAAPFVEVGDTVEVDTVVGIIETMKLMNSVYAGASGIVKEILIDNASYTDQDAVLMRIEPA